jgi:2-iminobutanoate/2-iminopropanoate deaminase
MKYKYVCLLLILLSKISFAQHKTIVLTADAPQPIGPYSQAVKSNGMVYLAGQIGLNPTDRKLVQGGTEAETKQIMNNIKGILKAVNLELKDIVTTTIYLKNMADFAKVNEVYSSFFDGQFPSRSTVGVSDLAANANIEITVIAADKKIKK